VPRLVVQDGQPVTGLVCVLPLDEKDGQAVDFVDGPDQLLQYDEAGMDGGEEVRGVSPPRFTSSCHDTQSKYPAWTMSSLSGARFFITRQFRRQCLLAWNWRTTR
jgi:hypothetical protein